MRFEIPGVGLVVSTTPIIPNGHFSWGEATKDGQRIPANKDISQNIIKVAMALEDVREFLGNKPIKIHSWYRPPSVNRAVGGASHSRHLVGDAVDFSISGICPLSVYDRLTPWWKGGLGRSPNFTHIDLRDFRARWNY